VQTSSNRKDKNTPPFQNELTAQDGILTDKYVKATHESPNNILKTQ
jgi:hypothetical protein